MKCEILIPPCAAAKILIGQSALRGVIKLKAPTNFPVTRRRRGRVVDRCPAIIIPFYLQKLDVAKLCGDGHLLRLWS